MGGTKGKVRPRKKAKAARPRDKKKEPPAVVVLTPCYFCSKKVDEKEYLCAGCDSVICGECEGDDPPWGDHEPEAHRAEPDDE